MTESDWTTCGSPMAMLLDIGGEALDRRRRLLGCGLGRHIWPALKDARTREAVEVAERFADGAAELEELAAAEAGARAAMAAARKYDRVRNRYACLGTSVGVWTTGQSVRGWGVGNANGGETIKGPAVGPSGDTLIWEDAAEAMNQAGNAWHAELGWFCGAIRCVFGNPFRPVTFKPHWRGKSIVAIAQTIYDDRAFDRLPILADALQEAGCEDADVLGHCRDDGPHVRGCWVVDLVLGKS